MPHNKKSPLGKKFENYSPSSSRSSFEQFERRKRRAAFWWIIPMALILAFSVWGIDQYLNRTATAKKNTELVKESSKDIASTANQNIKSKKLESHETPIRDSIQENSALNTEDIPISILPASSSESNIAYQSSTPNTPPFSQTRVNTELILEHQNLITQDMDPVQLESIGLDGFGPFSMVIDSPEVEAEPKAVAMQTSKALWELGIAMGPRTSWQSIEPMGDADIFVHRRYAELRTTAQSPSTGFNLSFIVNYNGLNFSALRSGIFIDQLKFSEDYNFQIDSIPVYDLDNTIAGYIGVEDTSQNYSLLNSSKQTYTYISLPIALSKKIPLGSKFELMVNPKISLNMLLSASGSTLNEADVLSTSELVKSNLNSFNLGYGLETGVLYKINRRYKIGVSGYYDRYTRPNEKNTYYLSTNHSYGLNLNLIYVWKWK